MKKILIAFAIFSFLQTSAQTSILNNLLQQHVTKSGVVDYAALKKNESELDKYITYLVKTTPDNSWSVNKQKAFWINAYNAYTLKIILKNYPLKSIMDIKEGSKTAWKIAFANVGGKEYTLDYIEHDILRKNLFDPRIHVGVNCASGSCPKLFNKAFTAENVDAALEQLMKDFINDPKRNVLSEKKIQISSIFDWFKVDFIKDGTVVEYIQKYTSQKINPKAKISYLKYDWSLNGK